MILVQLDTGSEVLYGSLAEFAGAIRRGEVGPSSLIYHRSSGQWLPIDVHPEFRKQTVRTEEIPLPPLERKHWTFFSVDAPAEPLEQPASENPPEATPTEAPGWRRKLAHAVRRFRATEQA
jgi:hypothetical protein